MRKFQSPIIEAEQWNGEDGHLGVKIPASPPSIWRANLRLKRGDLCCDCGKVVEQHGLCDEPDVKNLIVCPGDYLTDEGAIRPKMYFEKTYDEIQC